VSRTVGHGVGLDGDRLGQVHFHDFQVFLGVLRIAEHVAAVDHDQVQRPGPQLVDHGVARVGVNHGMLARGGVNLVVQAELLQQVVGQGPQRGVHGVGQPDAQIVPGEVPDRAHPVRISLGHHEHHVVAGDVLGGLEPRLDHAHEGDVAGEIGVGEVGAQGVALLHGLHLGDQQPAAGVARLDVRSFPLAELLEQIVDRRLEHGPAHEHQLGPVLPHVGVLERLEGVLVEGQLAAVAGRQVAGEVQRPRGMPAGRHHPERHLFEGFLGQRRRVDGLDVEHARGGVPHDGRVGRAELDGLGGLVDRPHQGDLGAGLPGPLEEGVPRAAGAQGPPGRLAHGRQLGVG